MRSAAPFVIAAMLLSGCAHSPSAVSNTLTYPYVAAPERQTQIIQGVEKIQVGMSASDVRSFMGEPDEVNRSYSPDINLKNRNPIGYSWCYIIERKTDSGSLIDKGEKQYRLTFDLNDRLKQVTQPTAVGYYEQKHSFMNRNVFYVSGSVKEPGQIDRYAGLTVHDAIQLAGGFENGAERLTLTRSGQVIYDIKPCTEFDLSDAPLLRNEDVINVE